MVSTDELKDLLLHQDGSESRMLSLYLNVDQTRPENLNRGFERTWKNLRRRIESTIDEDDSEEFQADADAVERFVLEYRPEGKTLVIFANMSRNFFWSRNLQVATDSEIYWEARPHIRPLIEAGGEFQRYGVILTDRAQARLFTIFMGAIEEDRQALAAAGVRRFNAPGTDHLLSQMNFQRKAEEHAKWHLKNVAAMMDRVIEEFPFERLILAGPTEAVSELKNLLPERLKRCVVGTVSLPVQATEQEILEKCLNIMAEHERAAEHAHLDRLFTGAGKNQMAVLGIEDTLRAVMERRVQKLLYTDKLEVEGAECRACAALSTGGTDTCAGCGGPLERVHSFVERLVERVTKDGGTVDMVREQAAEKLNAAGGIGALLRF